MVKLCRLPTLEWIISYVFKTQPLPRSFLLASKNGGKTALIYQNVFDLLLRAANENQKNPSAALERL
jgi:hypothetical protein